jgi:electron transfer flavoprotein alpha subunit
MSSVENQPQNIEFKGVWVYLEHFGGQFERVSLEILGKAQDLAHKLNTNVTGVILGGDVGKLAEEAVQFGADRVLIAESPQLSDYTTDAFSNVLADLVRARNPEILLFGATHNGRDLAGRLGVRLNTGLTAHAVRVEIEDGTNLLICGVPGFGGSIIAMCKCPKSRPQMATIRPGILPLPIRDPQRRGIIEPVPADVGNVRTKVVERSIKETLDITKADVVVIAGRGAESHLDLVKKLADAVGGIVGVTRPLADKGLMSRDHQVGSTGYALSSKLAIVFGASGAAHFVSGIRDARTVISVNKDPEAAIRDYSDFIVVDDSGAFLEAVISRFKDSTG